MAKLLLSALVIAVACLSAVDARPKCPTLIPICAQTMLYDFANQVCFSAWRGQLFRRYMPAYAASRCTASCLPALLSAQYD